MNSSYFIYEITPRCNSNCLYCYNVWKEDKDYPQGELAFTQIKELFEKVLTEISPLGITLTGGEPLLHPDIFEVARYFQERNIKLGLATNGILLTDEVTKRLIENGVDYFEISLPGIAEKAYGSLCQSASVKEARKAILNIKKHRAQLNISFVITKLNLAEIEDVIDLSFAFSANSIALNRFVPGGEGLRNTNELEITAEELEGALFIADQKSKEYNLPINVTIPIEDCVIAHQRYLNLNFGSCICGKIKWVIDPLGNLRTCEQNSQILGSLFEKSFSELANLEEVSIFNHANFRAECGNCQQYSNCGGGCRFLRKGFTIYSTGGALWEK